MDALAPYLVTIQTVDEQGREKRKEVARCPVCAAQETLREVRGMIICTHCFWALELRQAS